MRVLQVGSNLFQWGGIERYVVYLSEGLRDLGHDVSVTCPPGSRLAETVDAEIIPLGVNRPNRWSQLPQYLRLFRSRQFDVVHAHLSRDFVVPAVAAKLTKQSKVVMTRHLALQWQLPKAKIYDFLYDHFIGVSDAVGQALIRSGIPRSKVSVAKMGLVPPSVTRDPNDVRGELGGARDQFMVGFFGRLVIEKGVDVLLEASTKMPDAHLHIVGDGPRRSELESHPAVAALGRRVKFHGYRSDVGESMAAMDVIAIPSTWDEAFPAVALEAMSLGKPVVASRIGGLPEIIEHEHNGLLVETRNADDLAHSLERLRKDPEFAKRLGEEGQRIQRSQYTIPAMAERFDRVYRSLAVAR